MTNALGRGVILLGIGVLLLAMLALFFGARQVYPLRHREIIVSEAEAYDLDPLFVAAIIREESRFRTHAVSSQGAIGLMQLLPSTAKWVADSRGDDPLLDDQLLDPAVNVRLGCWYFAYLLDAFDGETALALAAYNSGIGRVKSWIQAGIWEGRLADLDAIPTQETREFVARVLNSYHVYQWLYPEFGQRRPDPVMIEGINREVREPGE